MQCFHHAQTDAAGICKYCGRGLCRECACDLGYGLACKGVHEAEVTASHDMFERNRKVYMSAPKMRWAIPLFFMTFGLLFMLYGFLVIGEKDLGISVFFAAMGVLFMVFALFVYASNRKIYLGAKNMRR